MKTGLVLEGGGMRGMYTVGVLDYLMDREIEFDYVIGVSAGACHGASFVSGQRHRAYRVNMDYVGDKRYVSLSNFVRTKSMFNMDFLFDIIPNQLDLFDYDAMLRSPVEFITGVTDAETGMPVYFDKTHLDHDSTILRASSAIPVFSPAVDYQGRALFDGGTTDPIPVRKALEDGCDRVMVVLTRDRSYVKEPEKLRTVYRRVLSDYPEMARALERRHQVYNETKEFVDQLVKEGQAVVIAPEQPVQISRFEKNRERLNGLYRLGIKDAHSWFQNDRVRKSMLE